MAIYVNKFKIPKSDGYDKDWCPSTQKSDVGLHVIHSFYPIIATSLLKSLLSIQNQQHPNVDNEQREEWQTLTNEWKSLYDRELWEQRMNILQIQCMCCAKTCND